ncbi:hypothetical protein, partial [Escherichia coli]|uniref:hypothetical protein n=1 Tax=Escherichia coli TaxID=562 RepID=UPI003CE47D51
IDIAAAFDRIGANVIEEFAEWKPADLPPDALQAMYKGHAQLTGGEKLKTAIAYAFGAEFVEVRVNKYTREIRVPRLV